MIVESVDTPGSQPRWLSTFVLPIIDLVENLSSKINYVLWKS